MKKLIPVLLFGFATTVAFALPSTAQDEAPPAPGEVGKATVINDPQNVIASELIGTWIPHKDLTSRLRGQATDRIPDSVVVFRESDEASRKICQKLEKAVELVEKEKGSATAETMKTAMRSIYLAGEMELKHTSEGQTFPFPLVGKFPFALVVWRGNPHVILYREVRGRDDFESFNVMLARDADGAEDLLFIGGDFNASSFRALERKKLNEGENKPD